MWVLGVQRPLRMTGHKGHPLQEAGITEGKSGGEEPLALAQREGGEGVKE